MHVGPKFTSATGRAPLYGGSTVLYFFVLFLCALTNREDFFVIKNEEKLFSLLFRPFLCEKTTRRSKKNL